MRAMTDSLDTTGDLTDELEQPFFVGEALEAVWVKAVPDDFEGKIRSQLETWIFEHADEIPDLQGKQPVALQTYISLKAEKLFAAIKKFVLDDFTVDIMIEQVPMDDREALDAYLERKVSEIFARNELDLGKFFQECLADQDMRIWVKAFKKCIHAVIKHTKDQAGLS